MPYNAKVLDHVDNPRNVGMLDDSDPDVGVGLVGAPACGDVMRFYIQVKQVDGKHRIVDAKFQTFGCGSAIASSSLLTEKVMQKTISEAEAIKNMDIYEELGLPPIKLHCSVLAEEAIKAAIEDWRQKAKPGIED